MMLWGGSHGDHEGKWKLSRLGGGSASPRLTFPYMHEWVDMGSPPQWLSTLITATGLSVEARAHQYDYFSQPACPGDPLPLPSESGITEHGIYSWAANVYLAFTRALEG